MSATCGIELVKQALLHLLASSRPRVATWSRLSRQAWDHNSLHPPEYDPAVYGAQPERPPIDARRLCKAMMFLSMDRLSIRHSQ